MSNLYIHDDGSITCVNHAPFSVRALLEQKPNKKSHWTPRGTWIKAMQIDFDYFKQGTGQDMECEACAENKVSA